MIAKSACSLILSTSVDADGVTTLVATKVVRSAVADRGALTFEEESTLHSLVERTSVAL
jgi:hypothetical protein